MKVSEKSKGKAEAEIFSKHSIAMVRTDLGRQRSHCFLQPLVIVRGFYRCPKGIPRIRNPRIPNSPYRIIVCHEPFNSSIKITVVPFF